jgi:hypothetical protein
MRDEEVRYFLKFNLAPDNDAATNYFYGQRRQHFVFDCSINDVVIPSSPSSSIANIANYPTMDTGKCELKRAIVEYSPKLKWLNWKVCERDKEEECSPTIFASQCHYIFQCIR